MILRLKQSGAGEAAPRPGEPMPPFLLPDEQGHLVSLEGLLGKGPVAITFHRGHWCPYCRISINALAQAQQEIAGEGGQIVAIMPERQEYAAEFKTEAKARYPILTDMDNGYAHVTEPGVLGRGGNGTPDHRAPDATSRNIRATRPGCSPFRRPSWSAATASSRTRFVDPDYRKRMAIDDLLQAMRTAAQLA